MKKVILLVLIFFSIQLLKAQNAPITYVGDAISYGTSVVVPIQVNDFTNIGSLNLQLLYDTNIVMCTSILNASGFYGMTSSNINNPGIISIGWFNLMAQTKPDSSALFNITFEKVTEGSSYISWYDDGYSCVYSDGNWVDLIDVPTSQYYIDGSVSFYSPNAPVTIAPEIYAIPNTQISVPISTTDFNNIGSLTLSLEYDPLVITYQSFLNSSGYNGLTVDGTTPGIILISGTIPSSGAGVNLADSSSLCILNFDYLGGNTNLTWLDNTNQSEYTSFPNYDVLIDTPAASFYINGSVNAELVTNPNSVTLGATNITSNSVTLNGTTSAVIGLTSAYFEYGLTSNYGNVIEIPNGQLTTPVSTDLNGLMFDTEYHFRFISVDGYNIYYGVDSVFTTPVPPPDISVKVSEMSSSGYSINDTVNLPVSISSGYSGLDSIQFCIQFDNTVLTPVIQTPNCTGLVNPCPQTTIGGGEWISIMPCDSILNINWNDPGSLGVNIDTGTVIFNLQFIYNGGGTDIVFITDSCFIYNNNATPLIVEYINGNIINGSFQTLDFPFGWSIFSTYVIPPSPDIADVFLPLSGEILIAKDGNGNIYWPDYYINFIGDLTIGEGYQVNMLSAQTLDVTGIPVIPELNPISIPFNWSIKGYLRNSPADIAVMLSGLSSELIIAKDGYGAVYWPEFFVNVIGNMIPGRGYQLKLNAAATLTYPPNSSVDLTSKVSTIYTTSFYREPDITGDNMTVCIPGQSWEEQPKLGSEIAIKDLNNDIVGTAIYTGGNTVITIWGDDELSPETDGLKYNEEYKIYLWDKETKEEYLLQIEYWIEGNEIYESNGLAIVGKVKFSNSNDISVNVYPNPCIAYANVNVNLSSSQNIKIELYDDNSRFIKLITDNFYEEGDHYFSINCDDLPSGKYQVLVQTLKNKESVYLLLIK